ncbi:MAG: alkaline phosphatase family protein [Calditrichaeota bacterium]|nr:MAG: alkaline phosphatase family protein [Calditrichota bacterium]
MMRKNLTLILIFIGIFAGTIWVGAAKSAQPGSEQRLLLISFDGFRWDYFDKCATPNFDRIIANGVKAKSLIPVFPSLTFPNHFSIVTGLYPENHGIISNYMFDPELGAYFSLRDENALTNGIWWGGEPIWITAEKQGVRAATFFWVGSEAEIGGVRPSIVKKYDGHFSNKTRVDSVLAWLDYPEKKRPQLMTLYFSFIDHIGHAFGPDSEEIVAAVGEADSLIGLLYDGIQQQAQQKRPNLVVVSDHGMAEINESDVIVIDDYIDLAEVEYADWYVISTVLPKAGKTEKLYTQLKDAHPHLHVYKKNEVPARFHFRNHRRIHPLVLIADPGWSVMTQKKYERFRAGSRSVGGAHGYDNLEKDMHGIFLAVGPAIKKNVQIPAFQNIQIYNAMNHILGTKPAKNDGNLDSLRLIFK